MIIDIMSYFGIILYTPNTRENLNSLHELLLLEKVIKTTFKI